MGGNDQGWWRSSSGRPCGRGVLGAVVFVFVVALACGVAAPAAAQNSPLPNAGFESGDLSGWVTRCFGAAGGCDAWSISVGPAYARSGQFGARLINPQVGWWGHAELRSNAFDDNSPTYTFPIKLVAGATQFYSGVFITVLDSTGSQIRYQGNTIGNVDDSPLGNPNKTGLFRMVLGEWVEYTFDVAGDFLRLHGRPMTGQRRIIIDAYQDSMGVELYVDDILAPRTQPSLVAVASLALNRRQIRSGEMVTGEVTLSGPAPAGGAVVTITSRNLAVPAPPPLVIPAGATRGTFTIQGAFYPTTRNGWITAICGPGAASVDLTVLPGPVTSLPVPENPVIGGVATLGAVQFASPAAVEGVEVSLFSSHLSVAAVPRGVNIWPGTSVTPFTVATTAVTAPTTVTLTAVSIAGVATTVLQVVPPPSGQPPALGGLVVSSDWFTGGNSVTATVTLTSPAPLGGALVTLASDQPSVIAPPASVLVPAGATSTSVTLATGPVLAPLDVTLAAFYAGQRRTAAVSVQPPSLVALTFTPPALIGGETTMATVTLTGPAPAGMVIPLANTNAASAAVPAAIGVPAGATAVSFPVTTAPSSTINQATVTATFNARTKSDTLSIGTLGFAVLFASVQDPQVIGGSETVGRVMAVGGWGASPRVFDLTSSNPAVVSVPTRVLLQPGQQFVTFPVRTMPVAAVEAVTLTASLVGTTLAPRMNLSVVPPTLASLSLSHAALTGGASATGTVALTGPAPPGGIVVTLAGSDPTAASVPATVMVPPGATTASFPVLTQRVPRSGVVVLTATLWSQTHYGALLVSGTSLSALALTPDSVSGGTPSQGTVTLVEPAPPGGITVSLASRNASLVTIPASVTVAPGATTATFTITTGAAAMATPVEITASYAGVTKSATLTVAPAAVQALTLNRSSVIGGTSVTGEVRLTLPAPPGGVEVRLLSDYPQAATVPASVTVPEGAASATFTVETLPVATPALAVITASAGGASRIALLYVNPPG